MNILLVSQCGKRALVETRRILDQFAERRGDRTWQTPITQEGLDTLRRLLKKSARRNTAVACHWIRGRDHSELIWIVGDASRFNAQGAVPTNSTGRDILRRDDENDWHTAEVIRLLAKLAGLLHDLGKASKAFQGKLTGDGKLRDAYRHEWVSLRLFQAFVGDDDDATWLGRLAKLQPEKNPRWLGQLQRDGIDKSCNEPLDKMPELARAIGWLVVSHHFLPQGEERNRSRLQRLLTYIDASWNRADNQATPQDIKRCWNFEAHGTPFVSANWCEKMRETAQAIQKHVGILSTQWLDNPYVAHLSRLCVMLADHHYSSLPPQPTSGDKDFKLFANTHTDGALKQPLDDHLIGVGRFASSVARHLPRLARDLPRIARHKGFSRRSKNRDFAWQDKAYDKAAALRQHAIEHGFFGVNMASTGCGKTMANARILYALADPQRGARISVALGLRSLTLQTGQAYRERLKLGPDDLAVRVGGAGVKALFERAQRESADSAAENQNSYDQRGSASAERLDDDDSHVYYEGSLPDGPLQRWLSDSPDAQRLISAPILVSTIDHLIPATEGTRGGRQIAPMLRLMSSDLVLDEPDDFDIDDLPALSRLVHWAGMLGSRVLLSSATLPPAFVQGLFAAYLEGRKTYQRNRGVPNMQLAVSCAWFDENGAESGAHGNTEDFAGQHRAFVEKRLRYLQTRVVRRKAEILPVSISPSTRGEHSIREQWAAQLAPLITRLHADHHSVDPETGKRISIGLIRMANIDPLIDTAKALFAAEAPAGHRLHLCCYHSQHPLLVRSAIEAKLDRLLNRTDPESLLSDVEIRALLDSHGEADQVIVVLATAVAEVGRDHDYDWAIVEPSSMRSIIQLAGRVMRHRPQACERTNVVLLGSNLRALEHRGEAAYCRPGFENKHWPLTSHQLAKLLTPEQYQHIDAAPRIAERDPLDPANNLVDLEHARVRALMLDQSSRDDTVPIDYWWSTRVHLSAVLQQLQRFRKQDGPRASYVLMPDEDGEGWKFQRVERYVAPTDQHRLLHQHQLKPTTTIQPWPRIDYFKELDTLAEADGISLQRAALRYGTVELRELTQGWCYHPTLGFGRNS